MANVSTTRTSPSQRASRSGGGGGRPAAQLVVLLDGQTPTAGSVRYLLDDVDAVDVGRDAPGAARTASGGRRLTLGFADPAMSRRHATLLRVRGRWLLEDGGSKNGTLIAGQRVRKATLDDGDVIRAGDTFFVFRDAVPVARPGQAILASSDREAFPWPELVTFVASFDDDLASLGRVVSGELPIVLAGETGTGKEVMARHIHARSGRPGDFVAVNCGAIPGNLAEAELFGVRKGAFSGATDDRTGLVRAAHRGTLFLDEIGDLPAALQVTLLRVLQEREVLPVGDTRPVKVDLRICVATHRDLAAMVERGEFRRDLHARLAGFALDLPPLHERREDLGALIAHLLHRSDGGTRATFTPAAIEQLVDHAWPENIRELERVLAAAVPLAGTRSIDVRHLPPTLRSRGDSTPPLSAKEQHDRDLLISVLERHRGNVAAVARELGKGRMQIHRWARRFGLDLTRYRA